MLKDIFREGLHMKIRYSSDADVCTIELKSGIPFDSIDLKEGVILHLDKKGVPLEIELIDASKFISLDEFAFLISPGMMKRADTGLEESP